MTDQELLSKRELEILELVTTGVSNKEIAGQLEISVNTVKVHLRNIYNKLGVNTRTEAALFAVRNELVGGDLGVIPVDSDLSKGYPHDSHGRTAALQQQKSKNAWTISLALIGMVLMAIVGMYVLIQEDFIRSIFDNHNEAIFVAERWQSKSRLPTPRRSMAVAIFENQIITIGGRTEDEVTGVVETYNPMTDEWVNLPSKPLPVLNAKAGVVGGKIYIPGGLLQSGKPTNIVEVFNPRNNTWEVSAPLPVALSAYALTSYEGRLYLFGGRDEDSFVNSTFVYDPQSDKWSELSPMPTARAFSGAAVAGGLIYVIGGFDGENPLSVNEVYSPELENTENSPWKEAARLPQARYAMGIASVADIIHVIGGEGGAASNYSYKYLLQEDKWQSFLIPGEEKWSFLEIAPVEMNIYAIGGTLEDEITGQNLLYKAMYSILLPMIE